MTDRDPRDRIRTAAERLIAERGLEVPLRDITAAAGQRNNSAIQYHFGSRDQLIEAIVEHRTAALEARRMELLAEAESAPGGGGDDVRTLVEIVALPMLEVPYREGATHYARFLEQARTHPAVADVAQLRSAQRPAMRIVMARLDRALSDLPPKLRRLRLTALGTTLFGLLADYERAIEEGEIDAAAHDLAAANIVDMLVAVLTATPSPVAVAAATDRRPRRRVRSA